MFDGRAVLCDFGVAVAFRPGEDDMPATEYGSWSRLKPHANNGMKAPEHVRGGSFDLTLVDVWGIGTTLLWALTDGGKVKVKTDGDGKAVSREWPAKGMERLSKEAVCFLDSLLTLDPSVRPKMRDVPQLPWLSGSGDGAGKASGGAGAGS